MACHVVITSKPTDSVEEVGQGKEHWSDGDQVLHLPVTGSVSERGFDTNIIQQLASVGLIPPQFAVELFILAAAVYVADKRVLRAMSPDHWTRDFIIHLPVSDLKVWLPLTAVLEKALTFLSGDRWRLQLREEHVSLSLPGNGEQLGQRVRADCVSLFSGGLDSCIGAIDLLSAERTLLLIGHYDDVHTPGYQSRVHNHLANEYGAERCQLLQVRVRPQVNGPREYEETTRSRSFLFIALGVVAATALGPETPLFIPENGFISLNVPLTTSRLGSLSTRTTHPYFMALLRHILEALNLHVVLVNPYRFSTKGEMIRANGHTELLKTIAPDTMSCAHPSVGRWKGLPPMHCGYCLPCLIRRAAMHYAGLDDPQHYDRDVLKEYLSPKGRGATLRAFQMALQRTQHNIRLSEILKSGPLVGEENARDLERYLDVYRRGMREIATFLNSRDAI